jgi:hypothetical protein
MWPDRVPFPFNPGARKNPTLEHVGYGLNFIFFARLSSESSQKHYLSFWIVGEKYCLHIESDITKMIIQNLGKIKLVDNI